MELMHRVSRREGDHMTRILEHLQRRHIDEPGVAEAITQFLVSVGALRPDGTVGGPPRHAAAAPDLAGAEDMRPSSGVWTPGSQQPGGEKKLWIPD